MIEELAYIEVKPGMEAAFEQGVTLAAPLFLRALGCRGIKLCQGIESPLSYLLRVKWDTVENHMVDFRGSTDFQKWRELVAHCFAQPPRVEHVQVVAGPF